MKPSFNKFNNVKTEKYQKKTKRKKETVTKKPQHVSSNPIESHEQNSANGQIISGYFLNEKSYKELIVQRVNNFLYGVLAVLVVFCFICYYFVSCKEVQLNQISRATLELNYENEELQNKIDSLQSYYNIDRAVSKSNILERAKHVVEVDAIDLPNLNFNKNKKKNFMVVSY